MRVRVRVLPQVAFIVDPSLNLQVMCRLKSTLNHSALLPAVFELFSLTQDVSCSNTLHGSRLKERVELFHTTPTAYL